MRITMGLDGGGTKTDCVLMDASGRILARARGGPSNPSRIGIEPALRGVQEAATTALSSAALTMQQITSVSAGLAGVADAERAAAMRESLSAFFAPARFELCTDLDLALSAARSTPAVVLVAGTGSAAIGKDANKRVVRSGGRGPQQSDEGSAFAIGKRVINELAKQTDTSRGELRQQVLQHLGATSASFMLNLNGAEADAVYPKVFPVVAGAADEGNEFAKKILLDAAANLAGLVDQVQSDLRLNGTEFVLGMTGGMIGRSHFFDRALDKALRRVAPNANLQTLQMPLAEIAAHRALSL